MNIVLAFAYSIELIISVLFFDDLFERKKRPLIVWSAGILLYVAAYGIFLMLDSAAINTAVFCLINVLFAVLTYSCRLKTAVICSLFLTAVMMATEFLAMIILSVGYESDISVYLSDTTTYLLMVVICKLLFLIVNKTAVFCGMYFKNNTRLPFYLLLYPITVTMILYTFWRIALEYELSKNVSIAIIIAVVAIIASVFLTFIFQARTSKKLDDLFLLQKDNERIRTDVAYYSLLDSQNEMLKKLTHDEKNHLMAIKSLSDNPGVNAYIDMVYGEMQYHSMFGNTSNHFLDLILNKYSSICYSERIDFSYSIKTANLSFMESHDIITLMSNILDNAVDAAASSQRKRIFLSLKRINGFEMLTCINSCDEKPRSEGKLLKTTKQTSGFHGLGMKSIQAVTRKYKGEFNWSYNEEKREFTVSIAFCNND